MNFIPLFWLVSMRFVMCTDKSRTPSVTLTGLLHFTCVKIRYFRCCCFFTKKTNIVIIIIQHKVLNPNRNCLISWCNTHSSILKDPDKTMKAMNKEDKNQYLITLPSWLARFIRHLHLTPQGLLWLLFGWDSFITNYVQQ